MAIQLSLSLKSYHLIYGCVRCSLKEKVISCNRFINGMTPRRAVESAIYSDSAILKTISF